MSLRSEIAEQPAAAARLLEEGAAVLARTIFHCGTFRLQSGRVRSLYFAQGLLLMGHAESVVALRVTTTRRQRRCSGRKSSGSWKNSRSFRSSGPLS